MEKQHGCPSCGKLTAGSPTEEGFRWAICDDCLSEQGAAESNAASGSSIDGTHGTEQENKAVR